MLPGILSDTHDELDLTSRAVCLLKSRGAERLVHCGDITTAAVLNLCTRLPTWFVYGNHDIDNVPELKSLAEGDNLTCLEWRGLIRFNNKKTGVTHGHMTMDVRPLLAEEPDYLLTGRFHDSADWQEGPTRRVCPGALRRAEPPTVALLNVLSNKLEFFPIT